MKSFRAICRRSMPSPAAMNFCSASGLLGEGGEDVREQARIFDARLID
jgi:hypothetical protein